MRKLARRLSIQTELLAFWLKKKVPISTVRVAIEALQNFDALENPARPQESLAISQLELNRLTLLVDKVLRMSLFEQSEPELKTESVDLRKLVEEVLETIRKILPRANW